MVVRVLVTGACNVCRFYCLSHGRLIAVVVVVGRQWIAAARDSSVVDQPPQRSKNSPSFERVFGRLTRAYRYVCGGSAGG